MKKLFFVDRQMCGGKSLPADFDLEDFCEVLQGKVPEVEVIAVTDLEQRAANRDPSLVSREILELALGEYCHR